MLRGVYSGVNFYGVKLTPYLPFNFSRWRRRMEWKRPAESLREYTIEILPINFIHQAHKFVAIE